MIDTTVFQNKTAVYYTLGCKLNFSETSTIGKILREAGVRTARKGEKADICVVNTCSVTEMADKKCRQAIHRLVKQHPGAFVVVTGCYAQLKPGDVAKIKGVDVVLGAEQKGDLLQYLGDLHKHEEGEAFTTITINILLVFVHQDHIVLLSNGNELAQLLDDSVTIVGRILAFRHKEAEHADVLAIQDLSDLAQRFQLSTLLFKALFIVDLDLANGTAQAGNANTSGLQAGQQIVLDFLNGKVGDPFLICTAQADVLHSKLTDCLELLIKRRADLVGKAGNINILHKNLLF